ncbi:MAG: AAA family ATPase [Pseudomonadota bacterium]
MKLLKLKLIGRYKGLSDQTFDFSEASGNEIAFIGLNGSGKSQLLELIAEIFSYLEREKRRDFKVRKTLPFKFMIEFRTGDEINLDAQNTYKLEFHDRDNISAFIFLDGNWQRHLFENTPLPNYVVGYASGLNENLQRAFLKNALQYFDIMAIRAARRKLLSGSVNEENVERINHDYSRRYPHIFDAVNADNRLSLRESDTTIPSTIFLDYDCNALLMASLALLSEEVLDELFPDIPFHYPSKIVIRYDLRNTSVEEDTIRDVKQLIREVGDDAVKGLCKKSSDKVFEIYELDYLSADITIDFTSVNLKGRLNNIYYEDPLQLFQKLYKIQLLGVKHWQVADKKNLRNDAFDGNVKKPLKSKLPLSVVEMKLSNGQQEIDFDDLSDGEAQLIQVLGAARIFKNKHTLFLLDEPETHLNPSWRTNFHRYLIHAMDGYDQAQVVLSTHSPFLISSLKKENVFRFERSNSRTEMLPIASETFGASFDVLIKKYFSLQSTISQSAVVEILAHLNDQTLTDLERSQWINEHVGESMEKAYLLRKLSS